MKKKSGFHLRAYVSTFLGFSGLVLFVSDIVLYIAPPGRVAHWANRRFLGVTKEQWIALHSILSFLFVAIGIWHLVYNWKPFIHYLKGKSSSLLRWKRESTTALLTVILIGALAILGIPPVSYVSDLAGIPVKRLINRLELNGYKAIDTETIGDIAGELETSPTALVELFSRQLQTDPKLRKQEK